MSHTSLQNTQGRPTLPTSSPSLPAPAPFIQMGTVGAMLC